MGNHNINTRQLLITVEFKIFRCHIYFQITCSNTVKLLTGTPYFPRLNTFLKSKYLASNCSSLASLDSTHFKPSIASFALTSQASLTKAVSR